MRNGRPIAMKKSEERFYESDDKAHQCSPTMTTCFADSFRRPAGENILYEINVDGQRGEWKRISTDGTYGTLGSDIGRVFEDADGELNM